MNDKSAKDENLSMLKVNNNTLNENEIPYDVDFNEIDFYINYNEIDLKFKSILVDLVQQLRKNKLKVSPYNLIQFLKVYNHFDIFDQEQLLLASRPFFAKSEYEYLAYEEIFNKFFLNYFKKEKVLVIEQEKEKLNDLYKQTLEESKSEEHTSDIQYKRRTEPNEKKIKELFPEELILEYEKKIFNKSVNLNEEHSSIESREDSSKGLSNHDNSKNINQKKAKNDEEAKSKENTKYLNGLLKDVDLNVDTEINLRILLSLNQQKIVDLMLRANYNEDSLKKAIEELLIKNILNENHNEDLSQLCLISSKVLTKISKRVENIKTKTSKELAKIEKEIQKLNSEKNREEFKVGKNSVEIVQDILNKEMVSLDKKEFDTIKHYMKLHASKFKTRISRTMKKDKKRQLDFSKTIKNSVKTLGIPIKIHYKKPKITKTKVVCIADISGSCIKSANLMLNFMYELSTVFKGGVKSYVFVKDIKDVSEYFKQHPIDMATELAINAVQSKGVYSNYGYAFDYFEEHYMNEIDKHTIVIFLGDARNNRYNPGISCIKAIKEKSRKVVWLNNEPKSEWNTGDSIMQKYAPYIDDLRPVTTTNHILNFLEKFTLN